MEKKNINIDNLISLASFTVSDEEKLQLEKEIGDFLAYAEIINNAPCNDLEPSTHAVEKDTLFRNDDLTIWSDTNLLLSNGPHVENSSYIVPPQKSRTGTDEEVDENLVFRTDSDYEAVIGLEIHAQLNTKTKLFCGCSTEFGSVPNNNTCPVCSGQPGVLPVFNREAVSMAILAGHAMNCKINSRSVFARKNYFYPDLPKGYQISQFEEPICSGGYIEFELEGRRKKVTLNRIHMEEDAGKLVHVGAPGIWGSKASAVDFNRSSVPLIEIVTEPDIRSAAEARECVIMIRSILVSLGLCDGSLEKGSLRCDANISIREYGDPGLGVKAEVKNMNSFKVIERATAFEIERQKRIKHLGGVVGQETRLWDEGSQKTYIMRSKEESHDYRYFPEPDLLPLVLSKDLIDDVGTRLGELPLDRKKRYEEDYMFNQDELRLVILNPHYGDYFEEVVASFKKPRIAANWFFNDLLFYITGDIRNLHITPKDFADFLGKVDSGEISGKIGKSVIKKSFDSQKALNSIISEDGLKQITDHGTIEKIVIKILEEHSDEVKEYKSGKSKVFGFLVGQVMKQTRGKASPQLVNEILKVRIDLM